MGDDPLAAQQAAVIEAAGLLGLDRSQMAIMLRQFTADRVARNASSWRQVAFLAMAAEQAAEEERASAAQAYEASAAEDPS